MDVVELARKWLAENERRHYSAQMNSDEIAVSAFCAGYNAAQHRVQRTALQIRILNAICYGITAGSLLWLLFGIR